MTQPSQPSQPPARNSAETVLADVLTEIAIAALPNEDVPAALLEGLNSRGWTLTNWNPDASSQVDLSMQFVRVHAANPIPGVPAPPRQPITQPQYPPLLGTESAVFSVQSWGVHKNCLPDRCEHDTPGYCPRVQRERLHAEAIKMNRRWEDVQDLIEEATWD